MKHTSKISLVNKYIIFFLLFLLGNVQFSNALEAEVSARSLVFNKGDEGSKYYRIPGLAVCKDGTIVAVADKRWDSTADLPGHIDVVCRRSTDGGLTWSDYITIAATDQGGGYGDPAIGVDPLTGDLVCVMTHGRGLWDSTADDHAVITTSRSSDGGITWSPAEPLKIKGNTLPEQFPSIEGFITSFATSGEIAVSPTGRMLFALVVKDSIQDGGYLRVYAVRSDDGGKTWQITDKAVDRDGDESKIMAIDGKNLVMSIRNHRKNTRRFSLSHDGGITWSEPSHWTSLPDPACNGAIIKYDENLWLHTLPASAGKRVDASLYASNDAGQTWQPILLICPAPSAYTSMVKLPDGSIGVLTEEDASDDGWRLWFTRINLKK